MKPLNREQLFCYWKENVDFSPIEIITEKKLLELMRHTEANRDAYWKERIEKEGCVNCDAQYPHCLNLRIVPCCVFQKLLSGGEGQTTYGTSPALAPGHAAIKPLSRQNRKGVIKQHQATADEIADTLAEGIVAGVISREEVLKRFPECSSLKETAGLYRKWDKEKKQKGVKP